MGLNKKGEITVSWIITIILLALGFIFLLVFYFNIGGTGTMDDEICHQSVILRATMPNLAQDYLPLKCKTKKICITSSGLFNLGACKDLEGEKGISTVKVKSVADIEKVYAEEILKCWAMMGEGKLELFHSGVDYSGFGLLPSKCVVCSRIAFDKTKLEEAKIDLSQMNVRAYMTRYLVPGTNLTYFEYIAGDRGVYTIDEDIEVKVDAAKLDEAGIKIEGASTFKIKSDKAETLQTSNTYSSDAILFMQVIAPKHGEVLQNTAETLGIAGGALAFSAPKLISGAVKTLWPLAIVAGLFQQGAVWYNRGLSASYCQKTSLNQKDARDGCSVVRSTGYNLAEISKYCTEIESIP
ncbi:hypothetical protein FJZ17_03615 [Candidatus Pacearchaeota archaeon]|nr:hypothetical protein [Candidatus Pacearchaeota archaeon]